jgi:protein TonB
MRASMTVLYGVSFALHASLGMGVAEIEPVKEPERIAIQMVEAPKPKPKAKEEPPPPPPPPPPPAAPAPKVKTAKAKAEPPPPVAAPAPVAAAAPTFGIAMTGGVGLGGVAVPVGESLGGSKEAPVKRVAQAKSLLEPAKKQVVEDACAEAASKPKPTQMARPEYTEEARAAAIEGKVRVELTVDATGAVRNVRVLESLGHGLDEAAVRAVEGATFEPALQCGKAVEATFVVSIRFTL